MSGDREELALALALANWHGNGRLSNFDGNTYSRLADALLNSDWLAAHDARVRAEAWDEGYRAGTDLGVSIGERTLGLREDWPSVAANPYREQASEAADGPETRIEAPRGDEQVWRGGVLDATQFCQSDC